MALPTSRNTTYAAGSQLKSADLNALQDDDIGNLHGYAWRNVEPLNSAQVTSGTATYNATFQRWDIDSGAVVVMRIPLLPGESLRAIRAYGRDATGNRIDVKLLEADSTGFAITGGTGSSDKSGTLQQVTNDFGEGTEYALPDADHHALVSLSNVSDAGTDDVVVYFIRLYVARLSNPSLS